MSRFLPLRACLGALLILFAVGPARAWADEEESSVPVVSDARAATDRTPGQWTRSPLLKGALTTPHFRIEYTARSEGAAKALAAQIEDAREAFHKTFRREWPGVTTIMLGVGREEYEAIAPSGRPPSWAVALAYPERNAILLEAGSLTSAEGFATLQHELSHVALGRLGHGWPAWFQEGMAMHLSGERYGLNQYTTLFRAIRQGRILRFKDLSDTWPTHPSDVEIAYAQSLSFVDYLVDEHGPEKLGELLDGVQRGDTFDQAFIKAFGKAVDLKEEEWGKALPARYSWLPLSVGNSLLWLGAAALCVAAFMVRRARKAKRLRELEAEDAAEDAARRLLAAEAAAVNPYPPEPGEQIGLDDDFDPFNDEPTGPPPPPKPTIH